MSVIDNAVNFMISIANDNSHGYDQGSRWGPNYDCSSLVITAYQHAGTGVKDSGATYTGNMRPAFLACGFKDVTSSVNLSSGSGLQRGDVLLNIRNHTAMFIGNGKIAQASINENGRVTGGASGDQTGGEINVRWYYNFPWDCVLRLSDDTSHNDPATEVITNVTETGVCDVNLPVLRNGNAGNSVEAMQMLLYGNGYALPIYGIDGDFGNETLAALKAYQSAKGLEVDGICGKNTWTSLLT